MVVKYLSAILLLLQLSEPSDASGSTTTVDSSRRILNGRVADPEEFRYHVYLNFGISVGSGAVISNYFILTVAHALEGVKCTDISIFPSNWTVTTTSTVSAVQCWAHENYVFPSSFYDIGLLRTSKDLLEGKEFTSIPLPAPGKTYPPGTHAIISGWGIREGGNVPSQEGLIRGDTYVIDWSTCYTEYTGINYIQCLSGAQFCGPSPVPKRSICIQGRGPAPAGACEGDSGSPVVIEDVLAGILSSGIGDKSPSGCAIGKPVLVTKVADFLPWIYNIIEPGRDTSKYPVTVEFH